MFAADSFALTTAQRDIWLDQLSHGDSPLYNIGGYVELDGAIDLARLRQALAHLVRVHDGLRTQLLPDPAGSGLPRQRFVEAMAVPLDEHDLRAHSDPDAAAQHLVKTQMRQHFALDQGPLLRVALIRLGDQRYRLAAQAHHLMLDGWGFEQFFHQLGEYYGLLEQGLPLPVAAPSYRAYIDEDLAYQGSARERRDREYWQAQYQRLPDALLRPRERGPSATSPSQAYEQPFEPQVLARMQQLASELQASPLHVLLAALHVCCTRSAQRDDWVVGLPLRNRGGARHKATLGLFAQVSALRMDFGRELSFAALVRAIADRLRHDLRHQRLPVSELNRALGLLREERAQLFEVTVSFEEEGNDLRYGALPAHSVKVSNDHEPTPLSLYLRSNRHNGKAWLHLVHNLAWVDADEARALGERLLWVLAQGLAQPERAVEDFELLTDAEQDLLAQWNATASAAPSECLVHRRIEDHAARYPDAVAAEQQGRRLTYGALNQQANALAAQLIHLGVGPEQRVAVLARRGLDTLVGLLAVLKAGAAYVPIDPAHPRERLDYLMRDCAPKVLLTQSDLRESVTFGDLPVIELDRLAPTSAPQANPRIEGLGASSLVYVIYTSGSTGQPKGVMVEQRMLANLVDWHCTAFDLRPGSHASSLAGFGFDAMAWEVWPTLCAGATLHLAPVGEGAEDIDGLLRWWRAQPLQVSFLPTPVAEHAFAQGLPHPTLRTLLVGGDRLRRLAREREYQVINNYGPTETTVVATSGPVEPGAPLHIGGAIANTRLYVLDARLRQLPIGAVGELYIGGAGVARGYLNRPGLTAERFLDDPFATQPGARLYRTGDLVRWRGDGTLEYLGRNDDQVKIRGVRVELGEIEAALVADAAVREAVVLLRDGQLVAWYIGAAPTSPLALHQHLRARLPAALLPAAYVPMSAWPLTANGKLDRRALPAAGADTQVRRAHEPPQGAIEQRLAALWAELLQVERVGRQDHFFELGGHSLLAVQLIERMRQQGLQVDAQVLFGQPTLASLAAAVETGPATRVAANRVPLGCARITPDLLALATLEQDAIERIVATVPGGTANVQEIYPLAPLQEGLLYHHLTEARDPYQQDALFRFERRADLDAFSQALEQVIARHDILRTSLAWEGLEQPQQVVWRQARLPLTLLDASPADAVAALRAHGQALDLRVAPMMALTCVEDQGQWLGLLRFHHLVNDAVSVQVLLNELRATMLGQVETLPAPVAYRNYVARSRDPARQAGHEAFFSATLAAVEAPPRLAGMDEQGTPDSCVTRLSTTLVSAMRRLARQHDVGLGSLLHLAWAQVLGALGGRDEVVFGSVLLGRVMAGEGAERALGMFVNSLPLRVALAGRSVGQALAATHAQLAALLAHEDAPRVMAQRCSGLPAGVALFDCLLNYRQGAALEHLALPGVTLVEASEVHSHALVLTVDDDGEALRLAVRAPGELGAARVLGHVECALQAMTEALQADPALPLDGLSSLPAEERAYLLETLNDTEVALDRAYSHLPALFAAQVRRTPDAVALQSEAGQLSYRELDAQANRLAHHLIGLGVGPDQRVAVCVERGAALLIGLLGVLKAGGAYVPLDPGYPDERLQYMLADSAPVALLVHAATRGLFADQATTLVDLDLADWQAHAEQAPALDKLTGEHLAYVMYTSGSTGTPKGVMVEHRGLCNLMHWGSSLCPPQPDGALLQRAPFSFDGSVWELFWPLCAGLRLVLARPDGHRDPEYLVQLIKARRVSIVKFVPALLHAFLDAPGVAQCNSLTDIFCGGGELTLALAQRLRELLPRVRLHNVYGPTEATVDSTAWTLEADAPLPLKAPPIGRPIGNTRLYVLDAQDRPVPLGCSGELHIGGMGVARGYLGLPALQAARFIASPFVAGDRLYRTGDLVRYRADGELEFLGRNDFQVKLNGLRIEPGELEALLMAHPALGQAVVLVRDERLVAYVTCREGQLAPAPEALRGYLLARVPAYMVPSAYVLLAELPLSPNGKVDRNALPVAGAEAVISRAYTAPKDALEEALAQIWTEVLKVEQVGRDDNFFELGGHSLLAVSLVARMRQAGLHADARTVFSQPTLAGLAAHTQRQAQQVEIARSTVPQVGGRRRI
ncbi:non-ribosomal peptide synthetase [Pseudomonas xantholysinigenes]|uniref:Amino acid adenylation domain-containing protein n=1 Tax=Pseudomonas xantholysinigenes TaxID=2745490 RepID=A0A9E6Q1M4_9PSED|nr:non-ribosomal peptide synthetase [Pseudomonas xantholysinigenes]QXI40745.1 amino acid adenylation domain-containing protein [Pseudomonas xantholysinigenes]